MANGILRAGGIYEIFNSANGKRYIGSSINLRKRIGEHQRKLDAGTHENDRLQKAYKKYGREAFVIRVVELVDERVERLAREQFWIDHHKCADRSVGYNIYPIAGSPTGASPSDEARRRMSEAQRRRPPISEETRKRLSESLKGRIVRPESIERLRASLTGYRHTPEARANMAKSRIGRKMSPEAIEKSAAARKGAKRSEESRARMAASSRKRWDRYQEERRREKHSIQPSLF